MPKLTIEVELSDHLYHAYRCESERKGQKCEELVARLVDKLLEEMEQEVADTRLIYPS